MSEQPPQTRICPTCGNNVPSMARYCPSCGTRLDPATAYTADDFEDALADVLEAPVEEVPTDSASPSVTPDDPTAAIPPVTSSTPSQPTEWTATASDWAAPTGEAGTWTAQAPTAVTPAKPRGNRTLWIILAILGFIVFCCCGSFFALLLIAESDTAFQEEVSNLAMLWIR